MGGETMKNWVKAVGCTALIIGLLGTTMTDAVVAKSDYIAGQKLPKKPTIIDGIILVNKETPLPSSYAPGESDKARAAYTRWNKAAKKAGYRFEAFSTYRSYARQKTLYNNYVAKDGRKAADRYSARPGFSEHQTGLAFDIGEMKRPSEYASTRFGERAAGKWAAKTAHRYGFIMRYPKGKEKVTGYMYEPWHFRYVGKTAATKIYKEKLTLEAYLKEK